MHVTRVRELHAVADQIEEHLTDSSAVADQAARNVIGNFERELYPLLFCARREQVQNFFHGLIEFIGDIFQLDASGLDLREVQNVVDDDQQALRRASDRVREIRLLARQAAYPTAGC